MYLVGVCPRGDLPHAHQQPEAEEHDLVPPPDILTNFVAMAAAWVWLVRRPSTLVSTKMSQQLLDVLP